MLDDFILASTQSILLLLLSVSGLIDKSKRVNIFHLNVTKRHDYVSDWKCSKFSIRAKSCHVYLHF